MSRIKDLYIKSIPELEKEFGYTNPLQVPKISKVVLNIGVGETLGKQQMLDKVLTNLTTIAGQKPNIVAAKKSVAGFKIREGDKVGISVTLRGEHMYDFIDRLITITLPRIRDFHGLPIKSFDRNGNYSMGIKEHTLFPEIPYDNVDFIHGLQISISTTAKTDEEAKSLLTHIGFPFEKEK